MSEKLSGVYTTVDTLGFVPDVARTREAILVVGNQFTVVSGASITVDDYFSSSNPKGSLIPFSNIVEVKSELGFIDGDVIGSGTSTWIDGTFGSTAGMAGYDSLYNMIRALELIYKANPSAKVYAALLSGSMTDPLTKPDGTDEALIESLKYKDIGFIVSAGLEFNSDYVVHCTTAASNVNQAERVYVGGVSMNNAFSGSADTQALATFDVSSFVALQETKGRSIAFLGNANYTFSLGWTSGTAVEGSVEIGGNMMAAYVAGLLSNLSEKTSLLGKGVNTFLPVYKGRSFKWSISELEANYDNSMLSVRFDPTATIIYHFEKAMTFTPKASAWGKITRRRIIDRVTKDVRKTIKAEIGEDNTSARRSTATDRILRLLRGLIGEGMIKNKVSASVFVLSGDEANGKVRANVVVTPVTEIEEVELTIGVDLLG